MVGCVLCFFLYKIIISPTAVEVTLLHVLYYIATYNYTVTLSYTLYKQTSTLHVITNFHLLAWRVNMMYLDWAGTGTNWAVTGGITECV